MRHFVFVTGNQRKADYLAHWLHVPVEHHKLDLDEIQSLDPHVVVEHKVQQAYDMLRQPVLVEDTSLVFTAMGRLPGTLVKWFLEEIGNEGLCKIADTLAHRGAEAIVLYGYYDGKKVHFFEGRTKGRVAPRPRGEHGMGWDPSFIPEGHERTFAEMIIDEIEPISARAHAVKKFKAFLEH